VTHQYQNAGNFVVTLVVTDDTGASSTAVAGVTVTAPIPNTPPVAVFSANPELGEAPLSVLFDAGASSDPDGSIVSYAWGFDD